MAAVLTDDVVVFSSEELQAPEVGTELLELEGKFDVLVGFDAVQQRRVGFGHRARVQLLAGNHVEFVVLDSVQGAALYSRTHDVHLIADLRVQDQTLTLNEPERGEKKKKRKQTDKKRTERSVSLMLTLSQSRINQMNS